MTVRKSTEAVSDIEDVEMELELMDPSESTLTCLMFSPWDMCQCDDDFIDGNISLDKRFHDEVEWDLVTAGNRLCHMSHLSRLRDGF